MAETIFYAMKLGAVFFFAAQLAGFIGLLVWWVWHEEIKPRLIPQAEIDAFAEDWIASRDNPEEAACREHWRAWHRCEDAEKVIWDG